MDTSNEFCQRVNNRNKERERNYTAVRYSNSIKLSEISWRISFISVWARCTRRLFFNKFSTTSSKYFEYFINWIREWKLYRFTQLFQMCILPLQTYRKYIKLRKKSVILLKKIIMLCIVNQKFPPQEPLLWKLSGE